MNDQQDDIGEPKAVLTTGEGEDRGAGAKDDLEGGTTGATSMTGGDRDAATIGGGASRSDAAPGGRQSPAGERTGPIGHSSFGGSPAGESGGAASAGPASNGSFASGTYNERGNVTGPDSPAGAELKPDAGGEGQGDDLANRLGGGNIRTGLTGAGAASGDMRAEGSERADPATQDAAGAGGPSAGDVGGMGGVRGGAAPSSRPPGGMSPVPAEQQGD